MALKKPLPLLFHYLPFSVKSGILVCFDHNLYSLIKPWHFDIHLVPQVTGSTMGAQNLVTPHMAHASITHSTASCAARSATRNWHVPFRTRHRDRLQFELYTTRRNYEIVEQNAIKNENNLFEGSETSYKNSKKEKKVKNLFKIYPKESK